MTVPHAEDGMDHAGAHPQNMLSWSEVGTR
jgi:hypothetical protein